MKKKKKKKKHYSPESPIDECKNREACVEMCRKKLSCRKGGWARASYDAAMKTKTRNSKKKLFNDENDGESSDENNASETVSNKTSKLESPQDKKKIERVHQIRYHKKKKAYHQRRPHKKKQQ